MPRYDVEVDPLVCTGSRSCVTIAPHAFRFDERAFVSGATGGPFSDDEDVVVAAQRCPVEAITVVDVDTGEQIVP